MMGLNARDQIGGAIVRRVWSMGPPVGTVMSPEQIAQMPIGNRRSLIRNGKLDVFPPAPARAEANAERHIVHNGGGRYDVIVGVKLNSSVLTREEAEDLATRPD
jgi:hypothetical protein